VQPLVAYRPLPHTVTAAVKQWAIGQGLQQWPNAATKLVGDPPLIQQVPLMPSQTLTGVRLFATDLADATGDAVLRYEQGEQALSKQ